MIYLLSMLFVLSILIFVHELGHFLAAKLFGVRVERFSIGFPPRLFGVKIGETDYCISAIPFGGYVKLSGMIDESMDKETIKGEPWEFMSKPGWQKVIILSAGVLMNFLLAVVILGASLYYQGEQLLPTTTVGEVVSGGLGEKIGFQKNDRIVAINGQPVHYWNDIASKFIENLGKDVYILVEREGRQVELVMSKDALSLDKSGQLDIAPLFPAMVGELTPGYPASQAGLQTGDRIVAIDGTPVHSWDDMTQIIRASPGKELVLTILRHGKQISVPIIPKSEQEVNEAGETETVGKIGIGPYVEHRKIGFFTSMVKGFENTIFVTQLNVKALGWLVTGKKSPKEILGGPIFITKMAGEFARTGFLNLLILVAHLSIMLAIVNILPIPALDGGHLAIIFLEGVRRKPLSIKTKMAIQQVGLAIILMLMFFLIFNDIRRFF